MHIIAGRFRRTRIESLPPGNASVRPSSSLLRESVFNILQHREGQNTVHSARVLDLFSGTGALGFEALSRYASFCTFVEHSPLACNIIRRNAEKLRVTSSIRVINRDATRLGEADTEPFSLLFSDPPYHSNLSTAMLAAVSKGGWLAPGALCVLEHHRKEHITIPEGFIPVDERRYGKSQVFLLQWSPTVSSDPEPPFHNALAPAKQTLDIL